MLYCDKICFWLEAFTLHSSVSCFCIAISSCYFPEGRWGIQELFGREIPVGQGEPNQLLSIITVFGENYVEELSILPQGSSQKWAIRVF